MKTFSIAVLAVLLAVFVMTGISAFNVAVSGQNPDTLPKKEMRKAPAKTAPIQDLKDKIEKKDQENAAVKDSINQNLDELGQLKPEVKKVASTLKETKRNLKETILKSDGDVQAIEIVYRIDTSPRPVVINVVFPSNEPLAKKRWFKRKD